VLRGRRRPDPLATIWEAEIEPMLVAMPGLRPIILFGEMRAAIPSYPRAFIWVESTCAKLPDKSALAAAFRYSINRRQALARLLTDRRLNYMEFITGKIPCDPKSGPAPSYFIVALSGAKEVRMVGNTMKQRS